MIEWINDEKTGEAIGVIIRIGEGKLYKRVLELSEVKDYRGNEPTPTLTRLEAIQMLDEAKQKFPIKNIRLAPNELQYEQPSHDPMTIKMVVGWFVEHFGDNHDR